MNIDFKLPPKLDHFLYLNTPTGIIQHTLLDDPALEHGYSIDDQTRALLVATQYQTLHGPSSQLQDLQKIYLDYIGHIQRKDGSFQNYISSDGFVLTHGKSEDNMGRVLWSLGHYIVNGKDRKLVDTSIEIVKKMNKQTDQLLYIRGWAYSLIGLSYLAHYFGDESVYYQRLIALTEKIQAVWFQHTLSSDRDGWKWFENTLTYANAMLPLSLLHSYEVTNDEKTLQIALESLEFLETTCRERDIPAPIGNLGWYKKGGKPARFDQQVIEAADMVLAYGKAYEVTADNKYLKRAQEWFEWFYGHNMTGVLMVDTKTGAVYDGLMENGVNRNKGAESTICYLLAYLELSRLTSSL